MSVVLANGVSFHVQRLGVGNGSPVVMAHGLLLGNLATWYFTTAPALVANHELLLYDLRGHGRSERVSTGYDVATMADDLAALTAELPQEPVTLVGHSFGALICLRFALDHPERVAKLVLVEAPLPPSRFGQFSEFSGRSPEQMVAALPEPLQAFLGQGGRQARRLLGSLAFLTGESSLVAALEAEQDIPDAELELLGLPTLCVYGTDSACLSVGQRLASVMPGAQLVELPGGHYLQVDCADELTRCIVEFIDG